MKTKTQMKGKMKRLIGIVSIVMMAAFAPIAFTGCAGTGVGTVITSAQAWLNDPKNQALIQEIAAAANILIGAFGGERHLGATTRATVTGKLAADYPNVPAGALAQIAKNPNAYLKK